MSSSIKLVDPCSETFPSAKIYLVPSLGRMWNDVPIQRKPPPVDMPPSTRAFLSPFSRSFTPPALINDPCVVDKKLTITPLLLGSRPLYVPRNPFAIDPAVERVRHYMGCKNVIDLDLSPSPVLATRSDIEWTSDEEERWARENVENTVRILIMCY